MLRSQVPAATNKPVVLRASGGNSILSELSNECVAVAMEDALRIECGVKPFSREETKDHTWELLDYGNFVIDVFQPEAREYYRLETLWNDAPIVDLSEAGIEHPEYSERIAQLVQKMESANDQA